MAFELPLPRHPAGTVASAKKEFLTSCRTLATLPALRHWLTQDGRLTGRAGTPPDTGRPSTDIVTSSVRTFTLRDKADFRRFVMTFCYNSLVFETKKLTKTLYLQGLERVKKIEPSSRLGIPEIHRVEFPNNASCRPGMGRLFFLSQ